MISGFNKQKDQLQALCTFSHADDQTFKNARMTLEISTRLRLCDSEMKTQRDDGQ